MKKKQKNSPESIAIRIAMLFLFVLPATLGAQEKKENINAHDFLIPRRASADKFENNKFSEHLFVSAMGGMTYLFSSDNGNEAYGPRASVAVGNWFTPVIGTRLTVDYGQWKNDSRKLQTVGFGIDYLMNITTFANRYRQGRVFELLGLFGMSYQATLSGGGAPPIHTYGLHAGFQAKMNISRTVSFFIEPQLAMYPDRVDGLFAWKNYDMTAIAMMGITIRPMGCVQFMEGCFSGIAVGTGNAGDLLFDTEATLGKWLDPVSGIRISAGSSTAFADKSQSENQSPYVTPKEKEYNISLSVDYLCNLSNLLVKEREDRLFSMLFVAGVGSYFPGSNTASKIVLNGRLGIQGSIQATKHCGVWLEPRVNLYQDTERRIDGQKSLRASMGLMIGTTYNF